MTAFVLVHGAWTWQRLTPLLRAHGFDVMTPTLTGQGDRTHLVNREVTLSLHVTDLVEAVLSEDLTDVILVAHSYAGIVATMAVDRLKRVAFIRPFYPAALKKFRHSVTEKRAIIRSSSGAITAG